MNVTLFLGAGFSAPFGLPVMDSFLPFADQSDRLSDEDRAELYGLLLEARRANSFLESSATNLEDILSFAQMAERLQLADDAPRRAQHLKKIVRQVYTTHPPNLTEYWGRYDALTKLLGPGFVELLKSPNQSRRLRVITTNYDMNVESALYRLHFRTDLGFLYARPSQPTSKGGLSERTKGRTVIPLFKLHGSVNWFEQPDGTTVVDDHIVDCDNRWSSGNPAERAVEMPSTCVDTAGHGTPLIVPPSFLKPNLSVPLLGVWAGAAKALADSHVVVFVGYSFPPSDTEMMYFLARALADNAVLRKIIVVDPQADKIVDRLCAPGSKAGSHFRSLLHPMKGSWVDQRLFS